MQQNVAKDVILLGQEGDTWRANYRNPLWAVRTAWTPLRGAAARPVWIGCSGDSHHVGTDRLVAEPARSHLTEALAGEPP